MRQIADRRELRALDRRWQFGWPETWGRNVTVLGGAYMSRIRPIQILWPTIRPSRCDPECDTGWLRSNAWVQFLRRHPGPRSCGQLLGYDRARERRVRDVEWHSPEAFRPRPKCRSAFESAWKASAHWHRFSSRRGTARAESCARAALDLAQFLTTRQWFRRAVLCTSRREPRCGC